MDPLSPLHTLIQALKGEDYGLREFKGNNPYAERVAIKARMMDSGVKPKHAHDLAQLLAFAPYDKATQEHFLRVLKRQGYLQQQAL